MNAFYCSLGNDNVNGMDRLSDGLPKHSRGAVIVTSRRLEVAQQMVGADNLIIPDRPMDKQNCWCILMDAILRDDHQGVYDYTNDIKDKIMILILVERKS